MQVHTVIPLFIRTHTHIHTHGLTRLFMTDIKNAKALLYHVIATGTCFSTPWFPAHTRTRTNPAC